jgi:hypothetical protein
VSRNIDGDKTTSRTARKKEASEKSNALGVARRIVTKSIVEVEAGVEKRTNDEPGVGFKGKESSPIRFWQQSARLSTVTRPTANVAPRSTWYHSAAPDREWMNPVPLVMPFEAGYAVAS